MNEVLQLVMNKLDASGGQVTYPEIYGELDFKQQQQLPQAIREGKRAGLLRQEVAVVEGQNVHTIYKL